MEWIVFENCWYPRTERLEELRTLNRVKKNSKRSKKAKRRQRESDLLLGADSDIDLKAVKISSSRSPRQCSFMNLIIRFAHTFALFPDLSGCRNTFCEHWRAGCHGGLKEPMEEKFSEWCWWTLISHSPQAQMSAHKIWITRQIKILRSWNSEQKLIWMKF